ncbi:sugar ABC transporter substrate-binding protein [Shouchella clausii]|uniref:Sugar ABC transporter substrate-binding protein n=1 Tax=Shouchella rhizosphaerae TaxID=866786 RepID=A0ABZ2D065_9BACI|nr:MULTISPECIES: sugar ABC transporter substrate-binding protein [Shouchella]ALA53259.1 N-Acetyl-D-glucosamine ABC transport system, sugar-binding protein [Shouchella clausii]MBU3231206.1 sugar ABC transporter substrate-binding protein [Shouchella clausii]MBU3263790.1 sugar ABC transporter substrate-binding protein [Shouchella clausii]MBU3508248.1 sugar ABC transporter substrate-binding protein [Shouchella clausii]MBU3534251.1 sugar ABC transporter substrate-binding protein [Shouchella clausii
MKRSVKPLLFMPLLLPLLATGSCANEEAVTTNEVELTWLVRSDPNLIKWEHRVIEEFEKEHPGIKVRLQTIPQGEIDQKLQTMIAGGNVPDVWSPNWADSGFGGYHKLGALKDLTPYIEQDPEVVEGIDETLLEIYRTEEGTFGLPILSMGSFLYYNRDLFDAAGIEPPPTDWEDKSWDWDAMIEAAKAITENDLPPTQRVYGILNDNSPNRDAWMFGGDLFAEETYETGELVEPTVTTNPRNYEAIQARYDLINEHEVMPPQSEVAALAQLSDPFLSGRVGMVMKGGWGTRQYANTDLNWGLAAYPYTNEDRQIPLYVDPWSISEGSKHPEEAWEFLKFLMDPDKAAKWMVEMTLESPAHSELKELWYELISERTGISVDDLRKADEGALKYGRPTDNHLISNFAPIMKHQNMTVNAIYDRRKGVEEGLEELQNNLKALTY